MLDNFVFFIAWIVITTLVIPRRYFANLVGWLAMAAALILIHQFHDPPSADYGVGYYLGLGIVYMAMTVIGLAVVLRLAALWLLRRWRGPQAGERERIETSAVHAAMNTFQLFCAGGLLAFVTILFVRTPLSLTTPSWLAHLIVFNVTASLWVIPRLPSVPSPGPFLKAGFNGFRFVFAVLVAAGTAMPFLVAQKAQLVAGDAPYCIQVVDKLRHHGRYRQPNTLLDLSGLTMKGDRQHHALLVTSEDEGQWLYYWSYRKQDFVKIAAAYGTGQWSWPSIVCPTQTDYAERLPLLFEEEADSIYVSSRDRTYRVPLFYRPKVEDGRYASVSLEATAPDFEPSDEPVGDDPRARILQTTKFVKIWLEPGKAWFTRLDVSAPRQAVLLEGEEEFGLTKVAISSRASQAQSQPPSNMLDTLHYQVDPNNAVTTLISCKSKTCTHKFLHNELMIEFGHNRSDLANWRKLQERLVSLTDSFIVR